MNKNLLFILACFVVMVNVNASPTPSESPPALPVITLDNVDELGRLDTLLGHSQAVGVVFSPDGKTLASHSNDGTVRLWDIVTGSEFAVFSHLPNVMSIAFSPDGSLIASGGSDKTVRVWDITSGAEQAVYEGHTAGIGWQSVSWSPDGNLIAAGSRDGVLRIWEADTGTELAVLHGHYYDVAGIDFSPDGKSLASASEDDNILIWDIEMFSQRDILSGHTGDVGDVAFSPDGSKIASISGDMTAKDNSIRIWDVDTMKEIEAMEGHSKSWYGDICFSPDGSIIFSSGGAMNDGTIHLYDATTGELIAELEGGANGIVGVAISPDGRLIASGSFDGVIEIWGLVGMVTNIEESGDGY